MNISERIMEAINEEQRGLDGIHASALSYDCLRRAYYAQTVKEGFHDLKTLITFWIGRQLHKTQILREHEVPIEMTVDGVKIVGTPDEYEDGILLEKKTCTKMPRSPNDHHVRQAEYYKVMLESVGKPFKEAHIVYIDLTEKMIQAFPVRCRPSDEIRGEMGRKAKILDRALKDKVPPPRNTGWLCSYCSYASLCFRGGENE